MTTDQPLVVARFKKGGFTRTGTIDEVLKSIVDVLPVDIIYFLVPHPDSKGYSLREAGYLSLDIRALSEVNERLPSQELSQETFPKASTTPTPPAKLPNLSYIDSGVDRDVPQEKTTMTVPNLSPNYEFGGMGDPDGLKLPRPKSQTELLNERGLEIPPPQKKKKGRPKKTKAIEGDNEPLPIPPKGGGRMVVRNIISATPAQAEAASQFGKRS